MMRMESKMKFIENEMYCFFVLKFNIHFIYLKIFEIYNFFSTIYYNWN